MVDLVRNGDGSLLKLDGELKTQEGCVNCCGACLEDCADQSISVTLPALTAPGGGDCPDCADVPAGPYTLDKTDPPEELAGCCYWEKTSGFTETDDCTITKIWASLCFDGDDATFQTTVEYAGGVIHSFSQTYRICELCALLPGAVEVASAATGECEADGPAVLVLASACCYQDCDYCPCVFVAENVYNPDARIYCELIMPTEDYNPHGGAPGQPESETYWPAAYPPIRTIELVGNSDSLFDATGLPSVPVKVFSGAIEFAGTIAPHLLTMKITVEVACVGGIVWGRFRAIEGGDCYHDITWYPLEFLTDYCCDETGLAALYISGPHSACDGDDPVPILTNRFDYRLYTDPACG